MDATGTPSDLAEPDMPLFAPYVSRDTVRLACVYATGWRASLERIDAIARIPGDHFDLDRLAGFYTTSQRQLPVVLSRVDLEPETIAFQRWHGDRAAETATLWVFAVPSGQILIAVDTEISAPDPIAAIPLLEDFYYDALTIDGIPLDAYTAAHLDALLGAGGQPDEAVFQPERHQIVFMSSDEGELPDEDVVQRLIYRADLPYRPDHSVIGYPDELNRRPNTLGAVGAYVSVLTGHQGYVESCALLATVQAIGAAHRLRQIREKSYEYVRRFRAAEAEAWTIPQRRRLYEELADSLGDLELEMSFSVEAVADLGLLVPALRIESFHNALCEAIDLTDRSRTVSHMLTRLRNAIADELTAVTSVERRSDERKGVRIAVAITFVTTAAGTLGLLFAFLSIQATQVNANRSMFDQHYLGIYLLIAGLIMTGAGIYAAMFIFDRREDRRDVARRAERLTTESIGRPVEPALMNSPRQPAAATADGEVEPTGREQPDLLPGSTPAES